MPAVPFSRLEAEFLRLYEPPTRRRSTWYKVRQACAEVKALPTVHKTSDLTPGTILDWLAAHSDRAPMSNRSILLSIRALCNYAVFRGYLRASPWQFRKDWITFDEDVEDDGDDPIARHLSYVQIGTYLDQLDAEALRGGWLTMRTQALGYTYVHTGLRKNEALGLAVEDVHLRKRVIRIRSRRKRKLKTRTSVRLVGIPEDLAVVYERYIPFVAHQPHDGPPWLFPGTRRKVPWFHGGPGKKPLDMLKAVGTRAGIENVTIHGLRRSISTHGPRLGLSRDEVRDLLGHATNDTQFWYNEPDADNARDVASRIRFRPSTRASRRPN